MTWEEFKNKRYAIQELPIVTKTDIDCPNCGKKLYFRNDIVLTSFPAQYQYECPCGFIGYSHAKWGEHQ